MNKGVELLLERMETHPEEFMEEYNNPFSSATSKWGGVLYELYQRVEQMDRDAGLPEDGSMPRQARRHKPLSYLSDEEVLKLHGKLIETRAKTFNQTIMGILLGDSHDPREKDVETYTTSPYATPTSALGTVYNRNTRSAQRKGV